MECINGFSRISPATIIAATEKSGTPAYLYDESTMIDKCRALTSIPNAFGLTVRYAMKANSNRSILRIIKEQGLSFDASSLNEVRRALLAGIDCGDIILTAQEVHTGDDLRALESFIRKGLKFNVCSLRQLRMIGDFVAANGARLAIRLHPGVGSGETASRNTGDKYSCFGVHLADVEQALCYASEKKIIFDHVHIHIGSGADPKIWRDNIDLELSLIEKSFPHAETVSFGGGLKEARMPGETSTDIQDLSAHAKLRIEDFYRRTGRKLKMEIEPGTFLMANAGYAITKVFDKKNTGSDGLNFIITDGGMEINARPLFYGAVHPFYIVSRTGQLLSSEFLPGVQQTDFEAAIVGKCCESGDSQCLNEDGQCIARRMAEPDLDDFVVIGGAGAYCSAMAPMNYNSHTQIPELLLTERGELVEIRRRQTLEQLLENEL